MARLPQQLTAKELKQAEALYKLFREQTWFSKTPQGEGYWIEAKRNVYGAMNHTMAPYDEDLGMPGHLIGELGENEPQPTALGYNHAAQGYVNAQQYGNGHQAPLPANAQQFVNHYGQLINLVPVVQEEEP